MAGVAEAADLRKPAPAPPARAEGKARFGGNWVWAKGAGGLSANPMFAPVHHTRLQVIGWGGAVLLASLGTLYAGWGRGTDYGPPPPTPLAQAEAMPAQADDLPIESYLPDAQQAMTPEAAQAYNLASPLEHINPLPPAFSPSWLSDAEMAEASQCMTSAIYYEAGNEPAAGQLAVAQVILNRLRHPHYPKSVCGVVYQGAEHWRHCQFTFACDGSTVE